MRNLVEFHGSARALLGSATLVEVRRMGQAVLVRPVATAAEVQKGVAVRLNDRRDRPVTSLVQDFGLGKGRFKLVESVLSTKSGSPYFRLEAVTDLAEASVRSYVKA